MSCRHQTQADRQQNVNLGDFSTSDDEKENLSKLLTTFSHVFSHNKNNFGRTKLMQHLIILTDDRPQCSVVRPLNLAMRNLLQEQLNKMQENNIVCPSTSE